jgi:hypothetical protein
MLAPRHHRGGEVVRARNDVRDEFSRGRIWNGRLEHTDDLSGSRLEANSPADDTGIGVHAAGPEAMGQHHRPRCRRSIVCGVQQAADGGPQAHHVEVIAADDARAHLSRFAETDHGEGNRGELRDIGQ